jgi:hypothetical protein
MKRWVGLGVIADNLVNIAARWPRNPARKPGLLSAKSRHLRRIITRAQTLPLLFQKRAFCAEK